jgi:hypothetical protein
MSSIFEAGSVLKGYFKFLRQQWYLVSSIFEKAGNPDGDIMVSSGDCAFELE